MRLTLWEVSCFTPLQVLEQAVAREVYEETGLQALNLDYRMSDVWPFPRSLMICYRVKVDDTQPVEHLDGEIRAARWFTAPELAQAIAESEAVRQKQGVPKLELPAHVNIDSMVVRPRAQASNTLVARKQ
ncbi:MAG: NUDIX domain-containing protein [Neisseria elongata]